VDDDGRDVLPGAPGEIVVRATSADGLLAQPRGDAGELLRRLVPLGDVGRWDADGYLTIVDRKKDMVLTGGENVYPREVEEVLYQHPAVLEAAVIGAPDPKWGEKVVAVVCRRADVPATELIGFCRERLASYKKPRHVIFIDVLPRNASARC
jgi:acyl-CoA synthetase (AMP-forming)/AMP-acid ligase II